ncbi:MAG: STAS/SEC14 domain-containing protein [Methylobacillus sp.]|jgi:hypothetical protein|nr:STAS/SEC14 domain-containing protein [Methylobacillus sp.]
MITINREPGNLIIAMAIGEFTLADFKELENATAQVGQNARLLVDLSDMFNYTIDVAWEEIRFARQHAKDFKKIAIVTDDQWIQWSAWLEDIFTDAELMVFDDYAAALAWVQS